MTQVERRAWESDLKVAGWHSNDGWWTHEDVPGSHNIFYSNLFSIA
jgi:hypothetical protein